MNDLGQSIRFYLLVADLINRIRTGWNETHWNVQAKRLESIGEHSWLTAILAINISSKFKIDVNIERVVLMLVIHEIGEVLLGDITPYDGITPEEKKKMEHKSMEMILDGLNNSEELYSLLLEFDDRKTADAKFAYFCDKLQANIMCKWYQDNGYQNELFNQKNNVAFNSQKCQKILADGAKTAFDVWYAADIELFEGDPTFTGIMNWLKNNNTTVVKDDPIFAKYDKWIFDKNFPFPSV